MRAILVTGSDTGVGKTQVAAALARLCAGVGVRVQIVKVLETGTDDLRNGEGDADRACRLAGGEARGFTLLSFGPAIAPAAAAAGAKERLSLESLRERAAVLPDCDWRIYEGAGGIATPVDDRARDWADLAASLEVEFVVIVVPDRLGAINQARLAYGRAAQARLRAGIWLNETAPVGAAVAASNRAGLREAQVPLWAEQAQGSLVPRDATAIRALLRREGGTESPGEAAADPVSWLDRCRAELAERGAGHRLRRLQVTASVPGELNLADNDYLDLAGDPAVVAAAMEALARYGTSSAASPLITGWREPHVRLVEALEAWHGFPCGLLWSSGYAANAAVLGALPRRGDLVLADRLVHHSMVAGMLRSGARVQRYGHLRLDELERRLDAEPGSRPVFVVTESVFSMDGDFPDLPRMAELKRRHPFCWILDEAHALGWYGPEGSGLARAAGVEADVDVLVGTLGKALASGGAYTLFRNEAVRDYLVNLAGEFIYSTSLPPANAAAAREALGQIRSLAADGQAGWQNASRAFRTALRAGGWEVPEGDSPIVPVRLDDEAAALSLAEALRAAGIRVGAVRPPTVPAGTSRLRFSLKRTFGRADQDRVLAAMAAWRQGRAA